MTNRQAVSWGSAGGHGLLMVLVDALRWDYVPRASFLSGLSERAVTGRLVEPFGFTPRSAYFTGVDVEPGGFTHMFEWNPDSSPFGASRFLPATNNDPVSAARCRDAIRARARACVSPFASSYVDPAEIPIEYLHYFDVAERECPWGADAPGDNLFGILRAHGHQTYACAWPDTNALTDAAIVARTLHELDGDARFAFVHLSGLDLPGHLHGPSSAEVQNALDQTDHHVRALVEHARRIWRYPRVILFGDHGMVPVVRRIDVRPALAATGLTFGCDFGYFIDSTTVRFWYFRGDARKRVRAAFAHVEGGAFLTDDQRTASGLDHAGWRNGEDFFLATPGVLFSPSFFGSAALKGMHGYDPGCADNQGAFLFWTAADETPRDAGPVRAARLFSTALAACDIRPPCGAPAPVTVKGSQKRKPSFTASGLPHHEALVTRDLDLVVDRVLAAVPGCEAIVLTGSFGRGEGLVCDHPSPRAVNDYDLMVVGGRPLEKLHEVAAALLPECHVDALDLAWVDPSRPIGASQFGHDLRMGSRVLYGARHVLERWGTRASAHLTMADAWLGLSNRVCGLLEVVQNEDARESARALQATKYAVALGDAYLISFADYTTLQAGRSPRFQELALAAGVDPRIIGLVRAGYAAKLGVQGDAAKADTRIEELLAGVLDLAHRTNTCVEAGELPEAAAAEAICGRRRQTGAPRGKQPSLPEEFAGALAVIYRDAWRLFRELATGPVKDDWKQRRDSTIQRWRSVIH